MADKGRICGMFAADDADRRGRMSILERCARLTLPEMMVPEGQSDSALLPQNYQSFGAYGLQNLAGKTLVSLYPPDRAWVRQQPSPEIMHDPAVPDEAKIQLEERLFLQDLMILASMSASPEWRSNGYAFDFWSAKRQAMLFLIGFGDVLEHIDDDNKSRVFLPRQYVTKRNSAGGILYHVIKEEIDPLSLSGKQLEQAALKPDELRKKTARDRMAKLYTLVEWQPRSRTWLIQQEVNDRVVNESEEPITPYPCTSFRLVPGENYGRGLVEANLGDLESYDQICRRKLDFAAMCSKFLFILDENATRFREDDLAKPSGAVVRGRLNQDGTSRDVGILNVNKAVDFQIVNTVEQAVMERLARAFLTGSASVRQSERTTATEVQELMRELDGALGGVYGNIAAQQQLSTFYRARYNLQRKRVLPKLPEKYVKVSLLTGVAALAAELKIRNLLTFKDIVSGLGERAVMRLNEDVILDASARMLGIYQPGLIRSPEEVKKMVEEALAAQAKAAAMQKAIDTTGNIIEAKATQPQGVAA